MPSFPIGRITALSSKKSMITDYSPEEEAVAATAVIKLKMQQTIETIEEEHLLDTCGAEVIYEGDEK